MDATGTLSSKLLDFNFSGKAWEFFKIWIVKNLLAILTLGIYSDWAKDRYKCYFFMANL